MSTTRVFHPQGENLLLHTLPADAVERLTSAMRRQTFAMHDVLFRPRQPIERVYFPLDSVMSVVTQLDDGATIETGMVGNEGVVGLPLFFNVTESTTEHVCQHGGDVLLLPARVFSEELARGEGFRDRIGHYAHAFTNLVMHSAACNRHHTINERAARWLLMMHDRVGADQFPLTHEFFAQMLGVRRAGVTVAAGALQEAGLITYRRGQVAICDRERLEAAACECYQRTRDEFDRSLRIDTSNSPRR